MDIFMHAFLQVSFDSMLRIRHGQTRTESGKKSGQELLEVDEGPPEDFHELDIFPTKYDILECQKPYLRKNIIRGAYRDPQHYLDVQFRLLREDYIYPLRKGVNDFLYQNGAKHFADIKLYHKIAINPPTIDRKSGRMTSTVHFDSRPFQRINWKGSKRLLYGALVCFSSDTFTEDLVFATVADRNVEHLKNGKLEVYFEKPQQISYSAEYIMAESEAYFEAYRHVLESLKAIKDVEMPFQQYLIHCNPAVQPPMYLRHQNRHLDFSPVVKEEYQVLGGNYKRNVFQHHNWPSKAELGLDESQLKALQEGLTKELAIIQGPPGTGKTYIGWQIAKILLKNIDLWNPDGRHPLLVVCYTNHALDQFLEGILSFQSEGIIRIGNRSQNEALNPFLLNNVRRETDHKLPGKVRVALTRIRIDLRRTENEMNRLAAVRILIQKEIPSWNFIREYVSEELQQSLCGGYPASEHEQIFVAWLLAADYKQNVYSNKTSVVNPSLIRNLMDFTGFSEILCKKAAYLTGNSSVDVAAMNIFDPALLDCHLPEVDSWPDIKDVDDLVEFGVPEQMVVDAFTATGGRDRERAIQWLDNYGQEYGADEDQPQEISRKNVPGTSDDQKEVDEGFDPDDLGVFEDIEIERQLNEDDFDDLFAPGQFSVVADSPEAVLKSIFDSSFMNLAALLMPKKDAEGFRNVRGKNESSHSEYAEEVKKTIIGPKRRPMLEEVVDNVADIWNLRPTERWSLLRYWMIRCAKTVDEKLRKVTLKYTEQSSQLKETRQMGDLEILRKAAVLGMTTTGAARYQGSLKHIQPPIVIMEEAAEVLEAHLITSLSPGCQHIILIGDHKQLRPNPSVYELARNYNLNISLFERLIENGFEYSQLALQHRMRPEISRTLMPHFYEGLLDDESVKAFKDIQGMQKNIFFLNHSQPESDERDTKSHKNRHEAELALGICKYLVQQEYSAEKITILVCYSGQLFEVKKIMKEKFKDLVEAKVRVTVVDNFQGEENDIIILSLVRSNSQGKIGFLSVPNRVCVAMSRARKGFYCIGNFDHLSKNCGEDGLWMKIVNSLKQHEFIGNALPIQCAIHSNQQVIKTSQDFVKFAPEGGCQQPCNKRMGCGHTCEKPCHAYDLKHQKISCTKPCGRMCKEGLHRCEKMCYIKCGDCMKPVMKQLKCGHLVKASCYKDVAQVICPFPCPLLLCCGHDCANRCSQPHTTNCEVKVYKKLTCGHMVKAPCSKPANQVRCTAKVHKQWPGCQHINELECSVNPLMMPCPAPCGQPLEGCQHPCKGTCGGCRAGRLHVICKEKCTNILVCGHECQSECGKGCLPCQMDCETACVHNKCGGKGQFGGRKCGDPCPPCTEKCVGICGLHRPCEKPCYEPCGLERCMEPCRKALNCKHNKIQKKQKKNQMEDHEVHRCIGVCGEPCLKVCKICDPDKFEEISEIFFGHEDEEDAIFIQLPDCKHIMEVRDLDYYVDGLMKEQKGGGGKKEICVLTCPKCKTPIRTCRRYAQDLKQSFFDIQRVKMMVKGSENELIAKREVLIKDLQSMESDISGTTDIFYKKTYEALGREVERLQDTDLCKQKLACLENMVKFLKKVHTYERLLAEKFTQNQPFYLDRKPKLRTLISYWFIENSFFKILQKEWISLLSWIEMNKAAASSFMISQFSNELKRFFFMIKFFAVLQHIMNNGKDLSCRDSADFLEVVTILYGGKDIKTDVERKLQKLLTRMEQRNPFGLAITDEERVQIVKAVGLDRGHWFKCPRGHIFVIGECGGAMEETVCYHCAREGFDNRIGGMNHSVRQDNQLAGEVDGARYAAWSDAANMENYVLDFE